MTNEEKLRAAEIVSNCKLPEALPYVISILGLQEVEKQIAGVERCDNIRKLMREKNVNDCELSRMCGLERTSIQRYRTGRSVPNDERYYLVMKTLEEM